MAKIRVCGSQQDVTRDIAGNVTVVRAAIDYAAREKANILLTPEGSLSGYCADFDRQTVGEALEEVTATAREKKLGLALGTCFEEPDDRKCYNEIRFYAQDGRFLGFHSKTLTCGSLDQPPKGEINDYSVSPLRVFSLGGVTVGGLICNDLWADPCCTPNDDPHLLLKLSRMGARVVFHAVNGGRGSGDWADVIYKYHESNLQMRARAAGVWVVTVDNSYPNDTDCSSPGGVVAPDGTWGCRVESRGPKLFAHTIELDT